jgi:type-F conjugative transfer system secretin TraK
MAKKILFILLFLPSVVFADNISFIDNATINLTLSLTDINRIAIFQDKILSINGPTGLYSAKNDANGAAYITLLGTNPFMLFISTVKGHNVSLFVRPQKVIGKTIVLTPTTPVKIGEHKEIAASYQKTLVAFINGMITKETTEEFIYTIRKQDCRVID